MIVYFIEEKKRGIYVCIEVFSLIYNRLFIQKKDLISDMTNITYLSPGVRELLFSVSSKINDDDENDQDDLSIDKIRQCLNITGINLID